MHILFVLMKLLLFLSRLIQFFHFTMIRQFTIDFKQLIFLLHKGVSTYFLLIIVY